MATAILKNGKIIKTSETSIYLIKNNRYSRGGWGNGYIVLPKTHKHYGKRSDK